MPVSEWYRAEKKETDIRSTGGIKNPSVETVSGKEVENQGNKWERQRHLTQLCSSEGHNQS